MTWEEKYSNNPLSQTIKKIKILNKQINPNEIYLKSDNFIWKITIDDLGKIKITRVD